MDRRSRLLALVAVVVAALATFAVALRGSFVNWDDRWLIVDNPYLGSLRHLPAILDPTGDRGGLGAEYLPLRDLSNLLDRVLFDLEPTGYRLGNLLLYAAACALALAFLFEAAGPRPAAVAAALLWAVHPLHAEVVAWASARKDLLNAVFVLLAATLHLRHGRTGSPWAFAGALAAFVLATLSKTSAAAVPVALAALEVLKGDPAEPLAARIRRALLRAAPMLAVAAAGAALNAWHQERALVRAPWRGGSRVSNLLLAAGVHARYLRQAVLPYGLSPDYALDEKSAASARNLLALLLGGGLLAACLAAARRAPLAAAAGLWWFLVLTPAASVLVPITNFAADRYLLLPSLGPCLLAGLAMEAAAARARPTFAWAPRAAVGAVVVAFGVAAASQARAWAGPVELWERAVRSEPRCGRAWQNYGEALAWAGRRDDALAAWERMMEAAPDDPLLWMHAGNRLWEVGGSHHAARVEEILRAAVAKSEPTLGAPLVALAWVVDKRGRSAEAVELLHEAVRRQPTCALAHLNIGIWHASEGRGEPAVRSIEESLRVGMTLPDEVRAHDLLNRIYQALGDHARAQRHREERERKAALARGEL